MGRVRQDLETEHTEAVAEAAKKGTEVVSDFDPARPWNAVFEIALADTVWWNREFERPALLHLTTKSPVRSFLWNDAPVGTRLPTPSPPGLEVSRVAVEDAARNTAGIPAWHAAARRQNRQVQNVNQRTRNLHNLNTEGACATTLTNRPLCAAVNAGNREAAIRGIYCPKNHNEVHLCNRCFGSDHSASNCHREQTTSPNRAA